MERPIVKCSEPFEAEEGCRIPSLHALRRYRNEQMQVRRKTFSGWTAQIIRHEIDHCNGILI